MLVKAASKRRWPLLREAGILQEAGCEGGRTGPDEDAMLKTAAETNARRALRNILECAAREGR